MFLQKKSFLVLGGDDRMLFLSEFLKENGYTVLVGGFDKKDGHSETEQELTEKIKSTDIVILPIPLTKDRIVLNMPYSSQTIKLEKLKDLIAEKVSFGGGRFLGCNGYIDLLNEEWLTVHNAELTAEGAISRALTHSNSSLSDCTILVAGFGRIGKQLARMLQPICRNLYVSARKEKDQAEIESMGYQFVHTQKISQHKHCFDLIFSTIPAQIFTDETLAAAKPGALFIDLASGAGSTREIDIDNHRICLIHALSIPGKDFPNTAGKLLGQTILQLCQEESI